MSVQKTNTMDAVVVEPKTGWTQLYIMDDTPWPNNKVDTKYINFKEKIENYVTYIQTGQLRSEFPNSRDLGISIVYACRELPPIYTNNIFSDITTILNSLNINFFIALVPAQNS